LKISEFEKLETQISFQSAVIFSGMFLAPFFTFSSATVNMKDTQDIFHWFFYGNFLDNAIKGSLQTIFGFNRTKLPCEGAIYCHFNSPQKIMQEFDVYVSITRVMTVLFIYIFLSRIFAYFSIKYRLKH
jgi:hypothetical protein